MTFSQCVAVAALAVAALVGVRATSGAASQGALSPVRNLDISPGTRLLVVAPHPDDEALGAAGIIQRVLASGGRVHVVLVTSGDGFPEGVEVASALTHPAPSDFRGYGTRRESETREALASLGVPPASTTFLGFPDGGLCRIASTYLFDKRRAFESPYTTRVSPPPSEQIVRGIKYRGVDVRRELERVITDFGPTLLLLPHPEDEHPDHCSTHIFTREALSAVPPQVRARARVLHYLIHYEQWPLGADAGTGKALNPPLDFPANEGRWLSLPLTDDEVDHKKQALLLYKTQMLVIGRFMLAFGRASELFLEGEPASLPECWCDGENVATEAPPSHYRRRPRTARP